MRHRKDISRKWLQSLKADYRNLWEQETVTITVPDKAGQENWTAPEPDMTHTYWLYKLTVVHEFLAPQMNQLLVETSHTD